MARLLTVAMLLCVAMTTVAASQDLGGALRKAASGGNAAEVKRLLAARAPLDAVDQSGQTPLLLAIASGHSAVARTLIDAGADINRQAANKDTPWLLAGARGHAEIIEAMLAKQPDLRIRNRFGGNALIPACERAHVEAVKVLLRSRIDVNHVNDLGWTCLLEIVILGDGGPRHVEVTRLVLAAGADPNIADRDGVSPLAHAKKHRYEEIARLIAQAGGR